MSPDSILHSNPYYNKAQLKYSFIRLVFLVLLSSVALVTRADIVEPSHLANPVTDLLASDIVIDEVDVLALSDEFKAVLDSKIQPIRWPTKRAEALHELLFGLNAYDIRYHGDHTRTAMETLRMGSGNCVSLANLFVAAARYVGLDAHFQEVQVPEDWEDREADGGYYVIAGHVNVIVELGSRRKMTVEFLQTYEGSNAESRLLSDDEALAQYYNNLGMLRLHNNELAYAKAYLQKAVDTYGESPLVWSNLGVVEKRLADHAAAETAYLNALKHDRHYLSAIKNLYVLYIHDGKREQAEPYAAIVEKYNRRNPYYLSKLAARATKDGDYKEAIKLLKRAIKIKDNEDQFHFSMAKAYYLAGDVKRSEKAMKKAEKVAKDPANQEKYRRKLEALAAAH